jgi:hypothetical protein
MWRRPTAKDAQKPRRKSRELKQLLAGISDIVRIAKIDPTLDLSDRDGPLEAIDIYQRYIDWLNSRTVRQLQRVGSLIVLDRLKRMKESNEQSDSPKEE